MTIAIAVDDPAQQDVLDLVAEHLAEMRAVSPLESVHALEPDALAGASMTFWSARAADGTLLGMAAMKDLGDGTCELKSMRTAVAARGIGLGRRLLEHAIDTATAHGCSAIVLETGAEPHFAAARGLYLARGFTPCPPFAEYTDDPNSVYLRLELPAESAVSTTA
jgi:putative acetyltransferase